MTDGDVFIVTAFTIITTGSVLWMWSFDTLLHKIRGKQK